MTCGTFRNYTSNMILHFIHTIPFILDPVPYWHTPAFKPKTGNGPNTMLNNLFPVYIRKCLSSKWLIWLLYQDSRTIFINSLYDKEFLVDIVKRDLYLLQNEPSKSPFQFLAVKTTESKAGCNIKGTVLLMLVTREFTKLRKISMRRGTYNYVKLFRIL